jgi:hypothetical protein
VCVCVCVYKAAKSVAFAVPLVAFYLYERDIYFQLRTEKCVKSLLRKSLGKTVIKTGEFFRTGCETERYREFKIISLQSKA